MTFMVDWALKNQLPKHLPVSCVPEHYSPCLEGWVRHGASCYRYNDTAVSQTEASETCHQFKGHLVYIDDDNENNFVQGKKDCTRFLTLIQ